MTSWADADDADALNFEGLVTYVHSNGYYAVVDNKTYVPAWNLGTKFCAGDYVTGTQV